MADPNVLLLIVDSLRADRTSLHGFRRATTPFLNSVADEATVYTEARAPDRWSLPSHASLFTGYHAAEHGVTTEGDALEPGHTVFERLADDGYATGVFSENPYLTTLDTGLAAGFETVVGSSTEPLFPDGLDPDGYKNDVGGFLRAAAGADHPLQSLANGVVGKLAWDYPGLLPSDLLDRVGSGNRHGATYTDELLAWVADRDTEPWAACVNYMDAHHPYEPAPAHDEWDDGTVASVRAQLPDYPGVFYREEAPLWQAELVANSYDGTVRQVDAEIERLFDGLAAAGELSETLVIVTADHGEGFGERCPGRDTAVVGHATGAAESNLHVPLVVRFPGQTDGETITRPTSLTRLPSLVERVRNGESRPDVSGGPVVARSSGDPSPYDDVPAETRRAMERDVDVVYEETDEGVRKVVDGPVGTRAQTLSATSEWTTTSETPADRVDLVDRSVERGRADRAVDDATERRLEQLGYR